MLTCTKWKHWGDLKSWEFDDTVISMHCFPFPPECTREIWRAYKSVMLNRTLGKLVHNVASLATLGRVHPHLRQLKRSLLFTVSTIINVGVLGEFRTNKKCY